MKTKEKTEEIPKNEIIVDYTNAYVLKGNKLEPFSTDAETAAKIALEKQSREKKFKSEIDLVEIVLGNGKVLFGEKTILINLKKVKEVVFSNSYIPYAILLDNSVAEKPKVYLVDCILAKENFGQLFMQITGLFSFFRDKEKLEVFKNMLIGVVGKNIGWRNKFKAISEGKTIAEFMEQALKQQPFVLLVMDSFKQDLTGILETYDLWGKFVKPITLRKFAINEDTIVTIVPTFEQLNRKLNGKKNGSAEKVVKNTEEDHLQNTSETMKEIFLQLKAELQKTDSELEFRVKKHYISLRKNRNLAFFQLGKKKLSIVIANPEEAMQFKIKHHKTLNLAESVKKFWNGNEHCFTVVIESKEHLQEVISLLKKLIAGGKEETLEETLGKEKSDANSALNDKAGKQKSQAKPKRKGKK